MKKIVRLTESDLVRLVDKVIKEQSKEIDPKRVTYLNDVANKISSKLVGKKMFFGDIGVLDNTTILVKKYMDRSQAQNLKNNPVKEFNLYYYVRRVEEDLNRNEKPGTRIWMGALSIDAKYDNQGNLIGNPIVTLYPMRNENIDFNRPMTPSNPISWDQVGGKDLWSLPGKLNKVI
jgi:hypothetical protein